jgi:hypothetical protein
LDLDLQRAFLTTWLLVNTNKSWISPSTVIVKTDADLADVKAKGAATAGDIPYIDMREIYPRLAPMEPADIDAMIATARTSPTHQATAAEFWGDGQSCCGWFNDYCLAMDNVLQLNS